MPNRAANAPYDREANEWLPPLDGIGPITADPAHPFYNNPVAADLGTGPTYRVADLDNIAAKNLMPWAVEALRKQNALVLKNRNGETRQSLGLTGFETYDIDGMDDKMGPHASVTVKATFPDGTLRTFKAQSRIDTPEEMRYYQHGGILQYVLRSLVGR